MKIMTATQVALTLLGLTLSPGLSRAATPNLLSNPGFEEGTTREAPPWGVGGWRGSVRATTAAAHSGSRSLLLEGGGDEGGINSAVQIVPIDPTGRTKYTLSAWIKVPSGTGRGRVRWLFDDGNGGGQYTDISGNTDWIYLEQGANDIIPPAGATRIIFRIYFVGGQAAAYLDDCEMVAEPSGQPNYPGVTGTILDQAGKAVAGALVFLKTGSSAQEFANYSAVTDSSGRYTVCAKDDGTYSVVAWKQGYGLSQEKSVNIANGAVLASYNGVLNKSAGGRNLALSTASRPTAANDIETGRSVDPQFTAGNLFDGNTLSSRYFNNTAGERWVSVDLDPNGKGTYSVNEFVLYTLGVTQMTQGWPGLGDIFPKDFAIEYTTKDPAVETEDGWKSHVAYAITDATPTFAPIVLRLAAPITARAVRLRATNPAGGGFGPVELQVNSDKLPQGSITGVVKDAATGSPIAGATVYRFRPARIQSDPDIYGYGGNIPVPYSEEIRNGTPYDYPVSKTIEQVAITDATGSYSLDANPGQPTWITAAIDAFPYSTAIVTPTEDGNATRHDFNLGKAVTISGVVKDSFGPVYNALVQIGGPDSQAVAITDADGRYNLTVAAGPVEVYADAAGHAGKTETLTATANQTRDITLEAQSEPSSLAANFETADGWEIASYDLDWKQVKAGAFASSTSQNATPAGKNSALIETANITDGAGAELPKAYLVLQRTSARRIAVESGKAYNIYFRAKSENWVSPEHADSCHFEIQWLDKNGAVVGRTYSHPYWINPQTFWQTYSSGHDSGASRSFALARVQPPSAAAALDLKIGWLRLASGATDDKPEGTNPAGSQLFIDDLVVDAVAGSVPSGQPLELGQTVSGYQDDFTGATRNPNWKPRGPGGDLYHQADGLLRVSVRTADPNHLLYEATGYSTNVQEVLARIRIIAFGANLDGPRGGIGVGVGTNSQGVNLHFRNFTQDGVTGRQFKLLDDGRSWGPAGLKLDWQTNVWYWLRLRQENNAAGSTNDIFAKVWAADATTPEPPSWQLAWNNTPARTERSGFAGLTGSSIDGVGNYEVDYVLIKAEGLPSIQVDFPPLGPAPTPPAITAVGLPAKNQFEVDWIGAAELQSTGDLVLGPWAPVANAATPYKVAPSGTGKFYRLKW